MHDIALLFGDVLRQYRQAAGLTQTELAERAGLSVRGISDLERGVNRGPRRATVLLLADALELTPTERDTLVAMARRQRPFVSAPPRQHPRRPRGPFLPIVGRHREISLIRGHLAGEGPPVLLLAGEPGIGKSRLLSEVIQWAGTQGWTLLEGGCSRRSGQEPFEPLVSALNHYCQRLPPSVLRARLRDCAWLVRLLPELLEAGVVPAPSWRLTPEQERRLMFAAVNRFLMNSAGTTGTLLVLDDLQWAGMDTLDLLATLVRAQGARPLRVIGAYRNTEVEPQSPLHVLLVDLVREGIARWIELGPLAREESVALLKSLLPVQIAADPTQVAHLLTKTGGVPFYLVTCALTVASGATDSGGNAPTNSTQAGVPWEVEQSIHQRTSALPAIAQRVLELAAVAGRTTSSALLVGIAEQAGLTEEKVVLALEALCQARLLVEEEGGTYTFAHDLIREVTVLRFSVARRALAHQQVGRALEGMPGESSAAQLAYHYTRAGDMERAVVFMERAGTSAQERYAYAEAEGYYRDLAQALDRLGRVREAAQFRERLGATLTSAMRYEDALIELAKAEAIWRQECDDEGLGRVLGRIGLIHASQGTIDTGLALLQAALPTLDVEEVSADTRAALYFALSQLYGISDRYSEALAASERQVVLARRTEKSGLMGLALLNQGNTLMLLDQLGKGQELLEAAIPYLEAEHDQHYLAFAKHDLANIHVIQGDYSKALADIDTAIHMATQSGHLGSIGARLCLRGEIFKGMGEWDRARADFVRAEATVRAAPAAWLTAYPLVALGTFCLAEGTAGEAAELLGQAMALGERFHDLSIIRMTQVACAEQDLLAGDAEHALARLEPMSEESDASMLPVLAWAVLECGEPERAEQVIARAIALAEPEGMRPTQADAWRIGARVAMAQGRWHEAEVAIAESLALAREMQAVYREAKTLYVYGLLHQARGEQGQACERFGAALVILNRLGERLYAEHVERALAEMVRR